MSNDAKRTGLWGKLTRGLFEFDAPLTADLLPLLPDPADRARRKLRRAARGALAGTLRSPISTPRARSSAPV